MSKQSAMWIMAALLILCGNAFAQPWRLLPGSARDIGVGGDGSVWVVGNAPVAGGDAIYHYNGTGWDRVPGGATRIDVDNNGNPWVVNSNGQISRWVNGNWERLPGAAMDIGIGSTGRVWVIGTNPVPGGYGIAYWTGSNWVGIAGGAVRIDVDSVGNPWVVNSSGAVVRWTGTTWVPVAAPVPAKDIAIGGNTVYIVGAHSDVYRYNGVDRWVKIDGMLEAISADAQGYPWGVNSGSQIFQGNPYAVYPRPSPLVTANNAAYVESSLGIFQNTQYGTWVNDAGQTPVRYREAQRNDTSIELVPTDRLSQATPILLDFAKKAVFKSLDGTGPPNPMGRISAVTGFNVSYAELDLYNASSGQFVSHVVMSENLVNGSSTSWNVEAFGKRTVVDNATIQRNSFDLILKSLDWAIGVTARNCRVAGYRCTVVRADAATGYNVGQMTFRSSLGLATLVQTDSTKWRAEFENMAPQTWVESNRTLDSIELMPSITTSKTRLFLNGRIELQQPGNAWTDNSMNTVIVSAERQWKGQLGTVFEPLTPAMSPGFQIRNATDFPVLVTLEQVGCLYYQIVQPGQIFQRNTGAVWFTIKASMAPNLQEPTVESCIRKPAMYAATVIVAGLATAGTGGTATGLIVPTMLAVAAGQGAAITTEVYMQAGGSSTLESSLARAAIATIAYRGLGVGLTAMGRNGQTTAAALQSMVTTASMRSFLVGAGYAADQISVNETQQADIDAMKAEMVQEAIRPGAYAGYPWPWKKADRIMPQFEISGGPRLKTFEDGTTIFLRQQSPLTITRVNNPY